jgi:hypothetical protein
MAVHPAAWAASRAVAVRWHTQPPDGRKRVRCRTDPSPAPPQIQAPAFRASGRCAGFCSLNRNPELPMTLITHSARITGPVPYKAANGVRHTIPLGPCLVERMNGNLIDIIWGASGQRSVALPVEEVEAAKDTGSLVLLD